MFEKAKRRNESEIVFARVAKVAQLTHVTVDSSSSRENSDKESIKQFETVEMDEDPAPDHRKSCSQPGTSQHSTSTNAGSGVNLRSCKVGSSSNPHSAELVQSSECEYDEQTDAETSVLMTDYGEMHSKVSSDESPILS